MRGATSAATVLGCSSRSTSNLAADYRLRGADAMIVAVALQFGTTLVTLDDQQRTRAATSIS